MNRVLVVRLSSLGDVVLTRPVFSSLRARWPDSRLCLLVKPEYAAIPRSWPELDEVLVFRGLPAALKEIRARRFTHLLDLHANPRSFLIRTLSGVGLISVYRKDALARRFFVAFGLRTRCLERSTVQRYVDALLTWKVPPVLPRPTRPAPSPDDKRLVGVHPGAAWATKRWPEERFADLCRRLSREAQPVLVGGAEDAEICARIAAASGAPNLAGKLTLNELDDLLRRCSLFVANDSGPMHLAETAGTPVVAIFGSTTRELGFFPQGLGHRVVEAQLACRPCRLHGAHACPEFHFLCMRLITVEDVWKACARVLAETPA